MFINAHAYDGTMPDGIGAEFTYDAGDLRMIADFEYGDTPPGTSLTFKDGSLMQVAPRCRERLGCLLRAKTIDEWLRGPNSFVDAMDAARLSGS